MVFKFITHTMERLQNLFFTIISFSTDIIFDSTRVVQKVLQMLGFQRYKRLILAKFVMLE